MSKNRGGKARNDSPSPTEVTRYEELDKAALESYSFVFLSAFELLFMY